jgi:hypothetical protein
MKEGQAEGGLAFLDAKCFVFPGLSKTKVVAFLIT